LSVRETPNIERRAITPEDREFLIELYAASRERELVQLPWTDEAKRGFIEMQFDAQDKYYREHYPDAEFTLLSIDGVAAGRFYVHRRADELRIVDIALLEEFRNRGIGGELMNEILAEGVSKALPVRIHVERDNPAQRLYKRLGFEKIGESGVYELLEKTPT
jgi:ribosomal protein S18 acetylase RimI-like enzyme